MTAVVVNFAPSVVAADLSGLVGERGGRLITITRPVEQTIGVTSQGQGGFSLLRSKDASGDELDLLFVDIDALREHIRGATRLLEWLQARPPARRPVVVSHAD